MKNFVIGLFILATAMGYGVYANPRWKVYTDLPKYGNAIMRAIIGIPPYVALIGYMASNMIVTVCASLITLGLLVHPYIRLKKDGYTSPYKPALLLLFASIGVYARIFLYCTLIGFWANHEAEIMARMTDEDYLHSFSSGSCDASDLKFSDLFKGSVADETPVEGFQEQDVEVVRTHYHDGWVNRENLRVNSDGTRYYDPDDGQWHRVKDLK